MKKLLFVSIAIILVVIVYFLFSHITREKKFEQILKSSEMIIQNYLNSEWESDSSKMVILQNKADSICKSEITNFNSQKDKDTVFLRKSFLVLEKSQGVDGLAEYIYSTINPMTDSTFFNELSFPAKKSLMDMILLKGKNLSEEIPYLEQSVFKNISTKRFCWLYRFFPDSLISYCEKHYFCSDHLIRIVFYCSKKLKDTTMSRKISEFTSDKVILNYFDYCDKFSLINCINKTRALELLGKYSPEKDLCEYYGSYEKEVGEIILKRNKIPFYSLKKAYLNSLISKDFLLSQIHKASANDLLWLTDNNLISKEIFMRYVSVRPLDELIKSVEIIVDDEELPKWFSEHWYCNLMQYKVIGKLDQERVNACIKQFK